MKIEIEVNNIETFIKALNNATAALGDICSSISLGCEPQINPNKFNGLKGLPEEELKERFLELKDVYLQLEVMKKQWKELNENDERRED